MALPDSLPAPHLTARRFGARRLLLLTDEALFECAGVRIAFTGREGGKSSGPYSSLNLGSHVDDDPAAVEANRAILLDALGAGDTRLIVPNQVHGDTIVRIDIQLLLRSMQRAGEPLMEPMRLRLQWKALRRCYALRTACP